MSSGANSRRTAFIAAVTVVVVAGIVAAAIAIGRSNNSNIAATATPSAATGTPGSPATAAAAPTAPGQGQIAFADCSGVTFGPTLQPQNPPSDVHTYSSAPAKQTDDSKLYRATITTAKGTIVLCLQPALAPNTVNNFVVLARNHFFDGLKFHRVATDPPVIQGGDPLGTGTGGPGYQFADEPVRQKYVEGAVAMANSGKDTNGSQFFIDTAEVALPPNYNIFGKVQAGLDVVHKIGVGDVMTTVTVAQQQ